METTVEPATFIVTFNGQDRQFKYEAHEKVEAVLKRAIEEFHVQQNPHMMSLFNEAGVELDGNLSLHDAGVKPGDVLILRQSTVKGGQ